MTDGESGMWRLTFAYEGEAVELVDKQWVARPSPPPSDVTIPDDAQGFWVEVLGEDGAVLHQEALREPVQRDAEVFSPDGRIERVPVEQPKGAFQVVVPDRPGSDVVVLRRSTAPATGTAKGKTRRAAKAVDVVRVGLHDNGPTAQGRA